MKKSLLLVGLMVAVGLSIASAKSYGVTVSDPTLVGATQLAPGEYTLKVEGTTAVFTNVTTLKSVSAPIQIENTDTKYDSTTIETAKSSDGERIAVIKLGGSKTILKFN